MLIDNRNLFPLNRVDSRFGGYYMDAEGFVFSSKRGGLRRLNGSIPTNSWGRGAGRTRRFTLNGLSYAEQELVAMAERHETFKEETHDPKKKLVGGYGPKVLSAEALGVDLTKVKGPIAPLADRSHAASVEQGVEAKGWIICSYRSDVGLIFSKQPAIHLTAESAKAEMERLAREIPGTKFVLLRILNTIVSGGVTWQ